MPNIAPIPDAEPRGLMRRFGYAGGWPFLDTSAQDVYKALTSLQTQYSGVAFVPDDSPDDGKTRNTGDFSNGMM